MIDVTEEIIARQSPEAQRIIRALLAQIASLRAELDELRREVRGKTPQNSSLPPSIQHPHAKPAPRKRKSKRKRGGQPGHKKHERPLIPTNECDDVESFKPTGCRRCGEGLSGKDPEPLRHQVWELPEIKPLVTGCIENHECYLNIRALLLRNANVARTSKSPRAVVLAALATARRALPEYAHRYSPKKFTQHQLFACLVLKQGCSLHFAWA